MAGDWIKVTTNLPDKPKVKQIARALGITSEGVVGHLLRVWIWADQQSLDGHAISVTDSDIDEIAKREGMAEAMRSVDWLTGKNGSLSFPRFDEHNTETAKKRALANKRQARWRDSNVTQSASTGASTREEKRREEEKHDLQQPSQGGSPESKTEKQHGAQSTVGDAGRRKARAPETQLPDDFLLTTDRALYAETVLGELVDAQAMFGAFREHHASKQTLMRDWDAGWRTWVQKGLEYGFPKKKPGGGVGGSEASTALSPAGAATAAAGQKLLGRNGHGGEHGGGGHGS